MTDDHSLPGALHPDHQDLLEFLYQFPIGVVEMTEDGEVTTINPAASRILSTELDDGESVARPLAVLRRLAPELLEAVEADRSRLGMITTGRGHAIDSRDGRTRFTVGVHRVRRGRLIVSLTDVTEERRLLNEQRSRARRLQSALLGRIDSTDLDVSVAYLPAHEQDLSGGDWYDVIEIDEHQVALVVGDVVGHDIEASAAMGQLRAIVRAFALVDADPVSVLAHTEGLARTIDGARYATVHYALIDRAASTVTYASAGHPPPLLLRRDGRVGLLQQGRRPVLAAVEGLDSADGSTTIADGDVLVVYTDGLIERRGEPIDVALDRLVEVGRGLDIDALGTEEIVDALTRAMSEDAQREDDVCVLAVRHEAITRSG